MKHTSLRSHSQPPSPLSQEQVKLHYNLSILQKSSSASAHHSFTDTQQVSNRGLGSKIHTQHPSKPTVLLMLDAIIDIEVKRRCPLSRGTASTDELLLQYPQEVESSESHKGGESGAIEGVCDEMEEVGAQGIRKGGLHNESRSSRCPHRRRCPAERGRNEEGN